MSGGLRSVVATDQIPAVKPAIAKVIVTNFNIAFSFFRRRQAAPFIGG
jgi:hypothetical protein